jgi:hypothetical protein
LRGYCPVLRGRPRATGPRFGEERIENITPHMIEALRGSFGSDLATRTKNKWLVVLYGVFPRAQTGTTGQAGRRDREVCPRSSGDIDVFSPEDVLAFVRAAGDEQDAAIEAVRRGRSIACCRRSRRSGVSKRPRSSGSAPQ